MDTKQERLKLKAGECVEVRSAEEILASLDENGRLEGMPFMPEMLKYCGLRFRVRARADKTCDNIEWWSIRRLYNSVHLEELRCDGSAHGGCEAGCLIFWKEAWLKPASGLGTSEKPQVMNNNSKPPQATFKEQLLTDAAHKIGPGGEKVYSCQATELRNFTSYMRELDPRQYVRDLRSGNLNSGLGDGSRGHRVLEFMLGLTRVAYAVLINLFNRRQHRRHQPQYPFIEGKQEKTFAERLDLQPGELVQVRSKEEIVATLDKNNRNRGLLFDSEMLPYCGGIYRVVRRVNQIVDEKTGKMIYMKNPCIVLEGVVCKSDFHRLCPRAISSYWRENWLKRVSGVGIPAPVKTEQVESCGRS
jgi:hypothetical protein